MYCMAIPNTSHPRLPSRSRARGRTTRSVQSGTSLDVGIYPTKKHYAKNAHIARKMCETFPRSVTSSESISKAMSTPPPPPGHSPTVPGPSPALISALRQVLRPLVRLMLSHGVNFPFLAEMMKGLFVEVAEKDFRLHNKPPTDSRVCLVSGVHRKDVSRLRAKLNGPDIEAPKVVTLGAELVARWLGSPQYQDASGEARPLARFASDGGDLSFEALVASVSSDIRSRVVLDEWLRLGIVHIDDERRVCLNTDAFVPAKGLDEKIYYFGHNIHDHAAAAVHNLLALPQTGTAEFVPFMERSVYCDELSSASLALLTEKCGAVGKRALLEVNNLTVEAYAKDQAASAGEPRHRMTFGIYFYAEPTPPNDGANVQEGGS